VEGMGGRRDWRKGMGKGREGEGKGGTCSKVLGGIDAPDRPTNISTFGAVHIIMI